MTGKDKKLQLTELTELKLAELTLKVAVAGREQITLGFG